MVFIDCPRCHGIPFTIGFLPVPGHKPKPTMGRTNVTCSDSMITYRCGNCGYHERVPYKGDDNFPEQSPERIKLRKDYERALKFKSKGENKGTEKDIPKIPEQKIGMPKICLADFGVGEEDD